MTTTLARGPRYRTLPNGDALAVRLARAWGVTVNTASVYAWGEQSVFRRAARGVRVMVDGRDDDALIRALAPIEEAKQPTHPEPLTPELWLAEAEADAAEDVSQAAVLTCPNVETARAYVRRLDAQMAQTLRVRRAILAHWGLA